MMPRAYLRTDPLLFEKKALGYTDEEGVVHDPYPAGAFTAFVGMLCLAEHQPRRGRFRSERVLRALLESYGKWVPFLLEKGDIVAAPKGEIYPPGWDEWQEGDWKVRERVARIRDRKRGPAGSRSKPPSESDESPATVAGETVRPVTSRTVPTVTSSESDDSAFRSAKRDSLRSSSGAVHSGATPQPPASGGRGQGRRVNGTNPRAEADADAERIEVAFSKGELSFAEAEEQLGRKPRQRYDHTAVHDAGDETAEWFGAPEPEPVGNGKA